MSFGNSLLTSELMLISLNIHISQVGSLEGVSSRPNQIYNILQEIQKFHFATDTKKVVWFTGELTMRETEIGVNRFELIESKFLTQSYVW